MKIQETGRSMIEMLGVLAIIGVLSVGGIAGYSKAMSKFRVNKTIDQISHIAVNTRILFGSQPDYEALGTATNKNLISKAKLFPDDMISGTDANMKLTNPFGGEVTMVYGKRVSDGDKGAFIIKYPSITQDACIDIATQDWSASSGSGVVAIGINNEAAVVGATLSDCTTAGALLCSGSNVMGVAEATTACNGNSNTIIFKFY